MIKVKSGNKKCDNCGLFKLQIVKTEKYYLIYECKECKTKYKEATMNNFTIALEVIDFIKSHKKKVFFGDKTNNSNNEYYLTQCSRFGDEVTYLLRLNEKKWEIIIDITKPDFKDILKILKSSHSLNNPSREKSK